MKKIIFTAVLLAVTIFAAACTAPATKKNEGMAESATTAVYQNISAEKAKERMDSGDKITVVDVRTQEEYNEKHIKGAILIPNETIGTDAPKELADKDAEILVYCRSGNRSKQAAEKLIAMGYKNVYDFGGINDWPYETVSGEESSAQSEDMSKALFGDFTSKDLNGDSVDSSIFSGKKLTMVNIWGTFCGPCINEMPDLGELNKEYADKDFQVVGVPVDILDSNGELSPSGADGAKLIIEKTGADYTHIVPNYDMIMAKLKDVSAIPETVFVDENGEQVGEAYKGARSKDDWKKIIDELLTKV